jgi:hypothetical protein
MSISATCPTCGQKGEVPESVQGLRVKCPTCGQPFKVPPAASTGQAADVTPPSASAEAPPPRPASSGEQLRSEEPAPATSIIPPRPPLKYPALRAIAAVNEALGLFALVAGLAGMLLLFFGSTELNKNLFISLFGWTVLAPLGFFASAQILRVFLDIEENTRYQNMLLAALLNHVARVQASRRAAD